LEVRSNVGDFVNCVLSSHVSLSHSGVHNAISTLVFLLLLLLLLFSQVWITIQRPGVFYGQCSELCGANHAFMPIVVEAVTPRQFVQVRRCSSCSVSAVSACVWYVFGVVVKRIAGHAYCIDNATKCSTHMAR
jgi:hypothetical protein